ncbi:MAG: hypothetical protein JST24_08915 [Acidobacteria bacterium]|nr:hypothetical protein [Acidobacteriota bacterium]
MADAPVPAAPKSGMNPILKWLLIGCGTIVLLSILVIGGCSYYVYHKAKEGIAKVKAEAAEQGIQVDTSNGLAAGIMSATNQGIVKSMIQEGQAVIVALPADERPAAEAAYKALDANKAKLNAQDMADLIKAHEAYQQAMMDHMQKALGGKPGPMDPDASRALVKVIQEVALRH